MTSVDPVPRLFALLGDPVAGNPTGQVIEAAFRDLGLDWRYVSCRVAAADLPTAVGGLRALGFAGAHVTIPHKVAVVPLVDDLTAVASRTGAVNCIVARDGRLLGDNTDGRGLAGALAPVVELAGAEVVLFGAGGAARAIGVELVMAGASSVRIVNRDPGRATGMAAALRAAGGTRVTVEGWPDAPLDIGGATIVVQATSIGMPGREPTRDAPVPVDWSRAAGSPVAADVVIGADTAFLRGARAAGRAVVTGIEMLAEQAALSVELWTGRSPDVARVRASLEAALAGPGDPGDVPLATPATGTGA